MHSANDNHMYEPNTLPVSFMVYDLKFRNGSEICLHQKNKPTRMKTSLFRRFNEKEWIGWMIWINKFDNWQYSSLQEQTATGNEKSNELWGHSRRQVLLWIQSDDGAQQHAAPHRNRNNQTRIFMSAMNQNDLPVTGSIRTHCTCSAEMTGCWKRRKLVLSF